MNKRKHAFVSGKADGGDGTLVRPSNWNADHDLGIELTNRTGGTLASGDIVALSSANDESVILADTLSNPRKYLVSLGAPADLALGLFTDQGAWTMKVASATVRGNYLMKSATAKSLEDSGRSAATTPPLAGDVAIALTGSGGAGTVVGEFIGGSGGASFTKGADIASAATLTIPAGIFYAHVTGTTTITAFGTLPAGTYVVLEFDGILTLTHSANLILPHALNYVTLAGEMLAFVSEGAGVWRQVMLRGIPRFQHVRLINTGSVQGRNAANSADLELISSDASNRLVLGAGVTNVRVVNQLRCDIDSTGRFVLPVGAGKWAT